MFLNFETDFRPPKRSRSGAHGGTHSDDRSSRPRPRPAITATAAATTVRRTAGRPAGVRNGPATNDSGRPDGSTDFAGRSARAGHAVRSVRREYIHRTYLGTGLVNEPRILVRARSPIDTCPRGVGVVNDTLIDSGKS